MKWISVRTIIVAVACTVALSLMQPVAWSADSVYVQTNLVSDIPGLAQSTDPNLKNPWGVSFSATSPFWVSNAAANNSTLYSGTGSTINARVVPVPGGPTGQISNGTTDFIEPNGTRGSFIFSTLSGGIYSWNNLDNAALQMATVANASFTGLALASNGAGNFLYAANISGAGSVEVFNGSFAHVTLAGSFKDPNLPTVGLFGSAAYVPYNVHNLNGQLYVEYANFQLGKGALAVFDANGNFVKELIAAGGPYLNQPWGVAIAPAGFGSFAGALLVGNLGDGKINAFDASTGAYLGTLSGFNGPIVNSGLWELSVRTGGTFDTTAVYLAAGINNQADGLFARLNAVTPSTLAITTTPSLPAGKIGSAYSQSLTPTGGKTPYSNWTVSAGKLPPGLSLDPATGKISGTPAVVGATFNFMVTFTDSTGATGTGSFQLPIQLPTTSTPLSRIGSFAQVASGGGWKSTLTLINVSASTVSAQINLYADNGSAVTLPVSFPQFATSALASSVSLNVGPNDSVVVETNASTSSIGIAWADVQASGPLTGYLALESNSPGSTDALGTVPLDGRLATSVWLPYDNTNGYQTGLAVANQSSTTQKITVTVLDQNGAQLSSSQMTLAPYGHSSFFMTGQFSKAANQLGIIQFQGTAGVTGMGLRMSPAGSFTSIPIIR